MKLLRHISSLALAPVIVICCLLAACSPPISYDIILRGGTIYDGSGEKPFVGDLAFRQDMIAAMGDIGDATAPTEINVAGLAVAPGFVNMMSWANESLIEDGRSQSDIRQGVTLEIMGEGNSMGPLNDAMQADMVQRQTDIRYDVEWTTLAGYLDHLERRGISPNVASFIGAATPRTYVIGHEDRAPTAEELVQMRALVRQAMEDGALGVASSLIYPPGSFANTGELIALSEVAADYDGMYISHMRDEGAGMLEAVEELLTIAREAKIRAEIYHFKSSGQSNWPLFDQAVAMVERARADGLHITAARGGGIRCRCGDNGEQESVTVTGLPVLQLGGIHLRPQWHIGQHAQPGLSQFTPGF
jgi:N-acyl-D-amino-acid deacylase